MRRGADSTAVPGRAPYDGAMSSPTTPPTEPDDDPDGYVGLDVEGAERRARERGWSTVRSLPPGTVITMEYRVGRLNFEAQNGHVTRAWKG